MIDFQENIRTHFNIIHKNDSLSLTLINPNISIQTMKDIKQKYKLQTSIKKLQIIILQTPNFDDQLLTILSQCIPISLIQLSIDFTGCESIKGQGIINLFQKISMLQNIKILHLDFSQIYDINDFVIQGLSMLSQNLQNLQQFYIDLYQIDQITQNGYLIFADCIGNLKSINKLHIDLCANYNLNQDALQLLFDNFSKQLKQLGFRILDIEGIGGGSFFKLSQKLKQMNKLQLLNLTFSTFTNLNNKAIYSIIKSISTLNNLKHLILNLSNIQLQNKVLSYLTFSNQIQTLYLDISCNTLLNDNDIVSLINKIPIQNKLKFVTLNFDFCKFISEQAIQSLIQKICENQSIIKLTLLDRNYSSQFINQCINIIEKSKCSKTMMAFTCNAVKQMDKLIEFQGLENYKRKEKLKRNIVFGSCMLKKNNILKKFQREILQLFLP